MALLVAGSANNDAAVVEELENGGELLAFFMENGQFELHPVAQNAGGCDGQRAVAGQVGAAGLFEGQHHAVMAQLLIGRVFKDRVEFPGHRFQAPIHPLGGLGGQYGGDVDFNLRPGPGPTAGQQQDERPDPQ